MASSSPKLGVIAGGGTLPGRLVAACRASGRDHFVIAFEGITEVGAIGDAPRVWVRLGAVSRTLGALREAAVDEVVMAGPVGRPSLRSLGLDARALKMLVSRGGGEPSDDAILSRIVRELESEGFRVVGIDDILGDLLAPAGRLGARGPDADADADIALGMRVVAALGAHDVGQAAVVQQGIVLGVEAVEGTDALIERCADLRRPGPGGVLVKRKKLAQERRADLPTIGPRTVAGARAAGLRGIAVEAGETLIVDRATVIHAADEAGLFVVGLIAGDD